MSEALLVLWIATISADRIDLFAGEGPFLLTPFLVLSPLVLGVELARTVRRGGRIRLPTGAARYALVATALLAVSLLSVFFSVEILLSAKRFVLLLIQMGATFLIAVMIGNRDDPARILVRGAYAGMTLGVFFNIVQMALWANGITAESGWNGQMVLWAPWAYGPWVPRLSGQVIDMNRGGLLFMIYVFIIGRLARPSRVRTVFLFLGALSVIATLSRSTMLALAIVGMLLLLQRRSMLVSPGRVLAGGLLTAAGITGLLLRPSVLEAVLKFLAPLSQRLTGDTSSSIHFALLRFGLEVGSASVKNALLGVGFGGSFAVLEEFFPGDKYGNFHSLYLTYWVETGVISLGLGLLLLLYPFARSSFYRPLIGGLLAFNLFYQTTLEPVFWFVLAAAWMDLAARTSGWAAPAGAGRDSRPPSGPSAVPATLAPAGPGSGSALS